MALSTPLRPAALPPRLSAATPGYFSYTPRQTATAGGAAGAVASPRAGGVRLLWRGALKLAAEDGVVLDGASPVHPCPELVPWAAQSESLLTLLLLSFDSGGRPTGLAFVSHLAFPGSRPASSAGSAHGTPPAVNPFSPSLSLSQGLPTTSALPSQDPDLGISLALESLRGRGEVHFRGRVRIGRSGGPGAASGDAAGASEVQGSVEGNGGVRLSVRPAICARDLLELGLTSASGRLSVAGQVRRPDVSRALRVPSPAAPPSGPPRSGQQHGRSRVGDRRARLVDHGHRRDFGRRDDRCVPSPQPPPAPRCASED